MVAETTNTNPLTPEQIEAIVDENGAMYQRDIIKSTFKIRTQGFWAGSGLGLIFGAITGGLVALATVFAGLPLVAATGAATIAGTAIAPSVMAILPTLVGAFSLTGMTTGAAIMMSVNASSGGAVGLAKVGDRKKLLNNPTEALAETLKYPGVIKEKETFWNGIIPFNKGSKSVFSARNALIFGAFALGTGALFLTLGGLPLLTAAFGVIGAHIATPAVAAIIAMPKVATTIGRATCGLFGAIFGIDGPIIVANATQFVGDLFGGKNPFSKSPSLAPAIAPALAAAPSAAPIGVTMEEAAKIDALTATKEKNFTQTITNQQLQALPAAIHV